MKKLLVIVAILLLLLLGFYAYLGGFAKLAGTTSTEGPYTMVYKQHQGDYAQVAKVIKEIESALTVNNIKVGPAIGIYYDDPKLVAKEDLRSNVGILIDPALEAEAAKIENVSVSRLPSQDVVVVEFPYKTQLSLLLGIRKAYPVVDQYLMANNYETAVARTEIYDMEKKLIKFIAPLVAVQATGTVATE